MSAEKTRRRVLLRSLPGFWIRSRRISGLIRRPAAPRPAEAVAFPWRLLSERCDSEISLANHGIWAAWCRLVMGLDPDVRRCRNMVHSVKRHNEKRNGRIRRYLPKKTSFDRLIQAELDAIVGEVNDTPDEAPRLQDTQRGMGRGDCQTTIKDDRSGNGCCTYKLNPGLPTFVILFARLAGVFMAPASTLLLSLAIEFQIFEAKVEQLLR